MADPRDAAQQQLAALLEASDDAIIGLTPQGTVSSWSRSAAEIFGYAPTEVIGQPLSLLSPPELSREGGELARHIAQGQGVENFETVRLAKNGSRVDVRLSLTPLRDENEVVTGALALVCDISARREAERAVLEMEAGARHRGVVLDAANRVALDILTNRTGAEALRHIAEAARVLAGARYAALGVAHRDGPGLKQFITVGLTPEEEAAIGPLPRGHGILGVLLERSEPLRINKLSDHPASVGFPGNHPPMDSFLGVPIRRGDEVLGSLYLTNKQGGGAFTQADEIAVEALGAHAAIAIHNLQLLAQQRSLVSSLITAQEEERRAVAYDLHDGLTQYVMASHAHLEAFKRAHASGKAEKATRELEQGLQFLKEAVVESRRLVNGLRLLALDDLGLVGALEQLIHEEKTRALWDEAHFIHDIGETRFDRTLETGVYRIAQEALTNARRHAQTARVQMTLLLKGEHLLLEARDWGRGFNTKERVAASGHVGLQGIIERVHLLGGTLELHSAPGNGTTLRARFPALAPTEESEGKL